MRRSGRGIATILYPTGMSGGGDPSQAIVKMKPDGSVDLLIGSVDIGQGIKTVAAQICAEELGVPLEKVTVYNGDTDTCPLCTGTFASRVTHMTGNAIIKACHELKSYLFGIAAEQMGVMPNTLVLKEGKVEDPKSGKSLDMGYLAVMANWVLGGAPMGRGSYMRNGTKPDPETGACDPFATLAYATAVADVEVDTDTGLVEVKKFVSAYDVGKAVNPLQLEGQIDGGTMMGLGMALMEDLWPCYPDPSFIPGSFADYVIPTAADLPEMKCEVLEYPSEYGPYGVKGIGEMTANSQSAAIVNAIYDAVGVWCTSLPVTPEKLLSAIREKEKQ